MAPAHGSRLPAFVFLVLAGPAGSLQTVLPAATRGKRAPGGLGGSTAWSLYADGSMPFNWSAEGVGREATLRPDREDPLYKMCGKVDEKGETGSHWTWNVTVPTLTPYVVPSSAAGRSDAAVVVIPGGGFKLLALDMEGTDYARWLNSIGVSAFVLKYRVPGGGQGPADYQIADVQRAVSLVRYRARELGLNPSRVGVLGSSAGGTLAVLVSALSGRIYQRLGPVEDASFAPDFEMLIYPGMPDPNRRFPDGLSLQWDRVPPTFVAVARNDPCTPMEDSLAYFASLQRSSQAELHVFPNGGHGYGRCTLYPEMGWYEVCAWTQNAELFLKSQVLHMTPAAFPAQQDWQQHLSLDFVANRTEGTAAS
mmetsp:Transcript_98513/g.298981  ORF Transcript_98513/g.298981 Transcript_98513/m.298981 type:complete len:366 (-) Transcript_98513:77-1174(-)